MNYLLARNGFVHFRRYYCNNSSDALFMEFLIACEKGEYKKVDTYLTERHVDPGSQNNLAIIQATTYGRTAIVARLLMEPRVDPTAQKNRTNRTCVKTKNI